MLRRMLTADPSETLTPFAERLNAVGVKVGELDFCMEDAMDALGKARICLSNRSAPSAVAITSCRGAGNAARELCTSHELLCGLPTPSVSSLMPRGRERRRRASD